MTDDSNVVEPQKAGAALPVDDAEISRLAKFDLIDYERERETVAKRLSIRLPVLDDLVGAFSALSGVEALTLLVDADENGISQCRAAECARAGGRLIRLTPRLVGADFNDLEAGS